MVLRHSFIAGQCIPFVECYWASGKNPCSDPPPCPPLCSCNADKAAATWRFVSTVFGSTQLQMTVGNFNKAVDTWGIGSACTCAAAAAGVHQHETARNIATRAVSSISQLPTNQPYTNLVQGVAVIFDSSQQYDGACHGLPVVVMQPRNNRFRCSNCHNGNVDHGCGHVRWLRSRHQVLSAAPVPQVRRQRPLLEPDPTIDLRSDPIVRAMRNQLEALAVSVPSVFRPHDCDRCPKCHRSEWSDPYDRNRSGSLLVHTSLGTIASRSEAVKCKHCGHVLLPDGLDAGIFINNAKHAYPLGVLGEGVMAWGDNGQKMHHLHDLILRAHERVASWVAQARGPPSGGWADGAESDDKQRLPSGVVVDKTIVHWAEINNVITRFARAQRVDDGGITCCPICGDHPRVLISDGTSIRLRRDLFDPKDPEFLQPSSADVRVRLLLSIRPAVDCPCVRP